MTVFVESSLAYVGFGPKGVPRRVDENPPAPDGSVGDDGSPATRPVPLSVGGTHPRLPTQERTRPPWGQVPTSQLLNCGPLKSRFLEGCHEGPETPRRNVYEGGACPVPGGPGVNGVR